MFERTIMLIGENNLNNIQKKKVSIIGLGGVGGSAFLALVRSGFTNITIVDHDTFDKSNLNRQVLSSINKIDKSKAITAKEIALSINENITINEYNTYLDKDNINILKDSDYIIDACDSIDTKLEIIKYAKENNIKLISSMGMGNRLDPTKLVITKLSKTTNDPLAKKIRRLCKEKNIKNDIHVVSSTELPMKSKIITSMYPVPNTAGILLASHIINDTIKNCES